MRYRRNVITLSDMDPELEEWARGEAKRANKPFYQVVNDSLKLARVISPVAHDLGVLLQEIETGVQPVEEAEEVLAGRERREP